MDNNTKEKIWYPPSKQLKVEDEEGFIGKVEHKVLKTFNPVGDFKNNRLDKILKERRNLMNLKRGSMPEREERESKAPKWACSKCDNNNCKGVKCNVIGYF